MTFWETTSRVKILKNSVFSFLEEQWTRQQLQTAHTLNTLTHITVLAHVSLSNLQTWTHLDLLNKSTKQTFSGEKCIANRLDSWLAAQLQLIQQHVTAPANVTSVLLDVWSLVLIIAKKQQEVEESERKEERFPSQLTGCLWSQVPINWPNGKRQPTGKQMFVEWKCGERIGRQ